MEKHEPNKQPITISSKTLTALIIGVVILISIAAVVGYIIGTTVGANNSGVTRSDQDINAAP